MPVKWRPASTKQEARRWHGPTWSLTLGAAAVLPFVEPISEYLAAIRQVFNTNAHALFNIITAAAITVLAPVCILLSAASGAINIDNISGHRRGLCLTFLPVSSSGHLALAQMIMGVEPSVTFALGVHAGTALAVLALYGRDVFGMIAGFFRGVAHRDGSARMALCLVFTSIPAAIVGFAASDAVEAAFGSPMFVAIGLLLSGIVLWVTGSRPASASGLRGRRSVTGRTITYGQALGVGVAQAIAVFPGVSGRGDHLGALARL